MADSRKTVRTLPNGYLVTYPNELIHRSPIDTHAFYALW